MEIQKFENFVKIGKKYYWELGKADENNILKLKEVPKKEIKEWNDKIEKIAEKLKTSLDAKKVLKEAIMKLEMRDIDQLHKKLFEEKRKYKPKTREGHCADMKIGNFILPIVD